MISKIKEYIDQMTEIQNYIDNKLKTAPTGHLRCTTSHKINQYFIDNKYVPKSQIRHAEKIAQTEYYKALLSEVKKHICSFDNALQLLENNGLENIYDNLCSGRKALISPIITPMEKRIHTFLAETYDPLPFREDDTSEIFTENGERVRSKSEKMIADKLLTMGIPYRYEKPLTLSVSGQQKTFRPDFTIMNKTTGKILYLEHLGMMDNPEYCIHAIKKIEIYEKNGYLLGDCLFITKETSDSPLSTKILERYIEKYFT